MRFTRRALLTAAALGVSGCAASPVIQGTPATAPTPPKPAQPPVQAAAQEAVATLAAVVESMSAVEGWASPEWTQAALAQCQAHLARLSLPDPFLGQEQEPFVVATPTPAPPPTLADGTAAVDARIAVAVTALEAAAAASPEGDLRLMYASAATATAALANRTLAPSGTGGEPGRLTGTTVQTALPVALTHAWALVYGLGVGIGRLASKDPLHALGTARLAVVKGLRNDLRAAVDGEPPLQPAAFALPTPMTTAAEIRAGWAVLETNLLAGYAGLVAATDDARWRAAMRAQVPAIQAVGGTLGHWPGWMPAA